MHVLSRRRFLTSLVITLAPLGAAPGAQEYKAGKVFRVGALGVGSPELLRQGLRELGYVEGLNIVIESRDVEGKTERFGELAAELVRLKVDVIVASNPAATFAAKRATTSIPIVMVNTPDPVQLGLVVSIGVAADGGEARGQTGVPH
jgi:putative tryptophan/tyrosine transport system substrate-binding protein